MERENTSSVRGFLRSYDDLTEKIRCLIQKKLIKKYLSSWRRTTGRLEDTVEELQNKYGEKTALKRIKSIVKKIRKKNIKHGAHSGNMTNQQPNNTNNNNSTSFGQPLIQNPNQVNLTIDQRNGGSIFAPIMVEKTIYGDVNFNVVSHSHTSVNEHEILPNVRNEMKSRMLRDAERTLEGSAAQSVSLNKIYTELFIISDETDPINRQHEIWQIEMTHNLNTSAQRLINYKEILQPPTDENIIVW